MDVTRRTAIGTFLMAPLTQTGSERNRMSETTGTEQPRDLNYYGERLFNKWAVMSASGIGATKILPELIREHVATTRLREELGDDPHKHRTVTRLLGLQKVLISGHMVRQGNCAEAIQYANDAVYFGNQIEDPWTVGQAYYRIAMAEQWYGRNVRTPGHNLKGHPAAAHAVACRGLYMIEGKKDLIGIRAMLEGEAMLAAARLGHVDQFQEHERNVRSYQEQMSTPSRSSSFTLNPAMLTNSRGLAHLALRSHATASKLFQDCSAEMLERVEAGRSRLLVKLNYMTSIAPQYPDYAMSTAADDLERMGVTLDADQIYRDRAADLLAAIPPSVPARQTYRLAGLVGLAA